MGMGSPCLLAILGRESRFLRFDLHQTLTEPADTLPKMFVFVWSHRGSGLIFDSAEKPSYYFLRFFSLSR